MSHILKRDNLSLNLFLSQLFAADVLVLKVVGAVNAAVYAVVRKVERREHYNTVAVKVLFNLLGKGVNFLDFFLVIAGKKHACLAVGNALAELCLFDNFIDKGEVVLVFVGVL